MKNNIFLLSLLCFFCVACSAVRNTIRPDWQSRDLLGSCLNYSDSNVIVTKRIEGTPTYIGYNAMGIPIDTLTKYIPKRKTKIDFYHEAQEIPSFYIFIEKKLYRYVVINDYKGYKFAVELWENDTRVFPNYNYRISILKDDKVKRLYYVINIDDVIATDNAIYVLGDVGKLEKYSLDRLLVSWRWCSMISAWRSNISTKMAIFAKRYER